MRTPIVPSGHVTSDADPLSTFADFSLQQLCHSDTALKMCIDNTPGETHRRNLARLSQTLSQVQTLLGAPLQITSAFRCAALNAAVGGVPDSQHVLGLAADFKCPQAGSPFEWAEKIMASELVFDQLILEFGRWIHISLATEGETPRREVLTIRTAAQGYLQGLVDLNGTTLA
jgi:hypothetical protein